MLNINVKGKLGNKLRKASANATSGQGRETEILS